MKPLAQGHRKLEPFGQAGFGDFARHRCGSSCLQLSSGIDRGSLTIRIVVWNGVDASLLARFVQFLFSSANVVMALR